MNSNFTICTIVFVFSWPKPNKIKRKIEIIPDMIAESWTIGRWVTDDGYGELLDTFFFFFLICKIRTSTNAFQFSFLLMAKHYTYSYLYMLNITHIATIELKTTLIYMYNINYLLYIICTESKTCNDRIKMSNNNYCEWILY